MPTLREVQTTFMNALLGSASTSAPSLVAADQTQSSMQLHVYRNNARANFHDSLKSSYPVLAKLVGADYFRLVARGLQQRHPSRSGDLLWVGEHLPDYLTGLHAEGEYRYLADVARLEWLAQESLLAADHEPLDFGKLAAAGDHHGSLIFVPHPTVRFFESRFPILRIWDSNVSHDESQQAVIDLASGEDRVLLLRRHNKLEFHRLNLSERLMLLGLLDGHRFAASVEECLQSDPSFDATTNLRRFVGMGVIVDCCW